MRDIIRKTDNGVRTLRATSAAFKLAHDGALVVGAIVSAASMAVFAFSAAGHVDPTTAMISAIPSAACLSVYGICRLKGYREGVQQEAKRSGYRPTA